MSIEQRTIARPPTWREAGDSSASGAVISGHASIFDQEAVIDMGVFAFRERIGRGAFAWAIRHDDVRALFNHDPDIVLGRSRNKTLTLSEDGIGLRYEAIPPKTAAANDVRELIRGKYVSGSSFAFMLGPDDDTWDESGLSKGKLPLRTINRVRTLLDVSPVVYPAYIGTDAHARSGMHSMREKATDGSARLPLAYKRIMAAMERGLACARCGKHVGLGWVTRGAEAMHTGCAELHDMRLESRELEARLEGNTPEARARARAAEAALDRAKRWRV